MVQKAKKERKREKLKRKEIGEDKKEEEEVPKGVIWEEGGQREHYSTLEAESDMIWLGLLYKMENQNNSGLKF